MTAQPDAMPKPATLDTTSVAPSTQVPKKRKAVSYSYRWVVASRCFAAALGSFALASAASIVLAWVIMHMGWASRASATGTATLASFALWCGLVMWAFHTASTARVWLNMLLPTVLLSALAWFLKGTV